jgi:hypothetical protein
MLWSSSDWVENKELVVGLRRTKEGVEVDEDLSGYRSGAGSMIDKEGSQHFYPPKSPLSVDRWRNGEMSQKKTLF